MCSIISSIWKKILESFADEIFTLTSSANEWKLFKKYILLIIKLFLRYYTLHKLFLEKSPKLY